MKKIIMMICVLLLGVVATSCDKTEEVDIYVTVYPVEYIVKSLVGSDLKVKSVYPRGQDIHDYDPTPKEIINMADCKLMFYIGSGLETFIENAKDTTFSDVDVYSLSDYLNKFEDTKLIENHASDADHEHEEEHEEEHEHGHSHLIDPHVWLDPVRMVKMSEAISEHLIEVYPEMENGIKTRLVALLEKLNKLDADYKTAVSKIDVDKRYIMVDHDAYQYWTQRYGIDRIKLRNDNESGEVELVEFDKKVEFAKKIGIKYVLSTKNEAKSSMFGNYLSSLGAQEKSLHHLATLTVEEEQAKEDYISLMNYNLEILNLVLPK